MLFVYLIIEPFSNKKNTTDYVVPSLYGVGQTQVVGRYVPLLLERA